MAVNGHAVYLGFDSDVMEKLEVRKALTRPRGFLESRCAKVQMILLQAPLRGAEVGRTAADSAPMPSDGHGMCTTPVAQVVREVGARVPMRTEGPPA